ncbi:diguanylate cyclase (GGDEF)-like protein/PAS domain S-box-containing protein [Oxalobacteraceae bacterium GrIS 1.11]
MERGDGAILDALDAAIAVLDPQGVIRLANQAWRCLALASVDGLGPSAPCAEIGADFLAACRSRVGGGMQDAAGHAIRAVIEGRLPAGFSRDYPAHATCRQPWLRMRVTPLAGAQAGGAVVSYTTVSAPGWAEQRLDLAASVFAHAHEGIMVTNLDGDIVDVNGAFCAITGYQREEVLGRKPGLLSSGRQGAAFYAALWRDLLNKRHWCGEIWNRRKNGEVYAEWLTICAVCDGAGTPRQYVGIFSDLSAFKEHERKLEHILHFDTLTGLPNRALLLDRLRQAMAQAQRCGRQVAVLYLDLDGFTAINERHGHVAGDSLLIAVAARMQLALREGDTLARIGGDEFVALLLDLEHVAASAPILASLLEAAARPVCLGALGLQVSASIGVTFYPQQQELDADRLLRQADQALYLSKQSGKNRYQLFDAAHELSVRARYHSLTRLREALARNEFTLHYQPKVNMRTGSVVGAEALIRWQHPERGLLPPSQFLPDIEAHALSISVGEWVIDSALCQMDVWRAAGLHIPVSVNLGAHQLQQPDFVERLRRMLALHPDTRPRDLALEVLETSALEDVARASEVMRACRKLGVDFSLDDFGTGYSSLTYLKRLPVSQLKIDQSFVRDMLDDPDDLSILEGVIGLAEAFRLEVIAEGVETIAHGKMLLQLGCELAQGYGIARPMPGPALPAWAANWRPDPAWLQRPPINRNDFPLLFAGVEHRAWMATMETLLMGAANDGPGLDLHRCRLGAWLEEEGLARHATLANFQSIRRSHQQVHALVRQLLALHGAGRHCEARAGRHELRRLGDALQKQLQTLLEETTDAPGAPEELLHQLKRRPDRVCRERQEMEEEKWMSRPIQL